MDDLIRDFITETREGLEALDSELVRFEQNPSDPVLLGSVFRLIHTIKGTSGFLSLGRLQAVAHAAENLLGDYRDSALDVSAEGVSSVLQTVDLIRSLIDRLAQDGVEPPGDDSELIARLARAASPAPGAAPAPAAPAVKTRPLIERLGGDAAIDAASEMVMARLEETDLAAVFAGADRDLLQFDLRDGLIAVARGEAERADLVIRLAPYCVEGGAVAALEGVAAAISLALIGLEIDPADAAELAERIVASSQEEPVLSAASPSPPPSESAPSSPSPSPSPPAPVNPGPGPVASPVAGAGDAELSAVSQTIRVNVDALEHLMTVVSELVLIRNQLIQAVRLEPESPFAAPLNRLNQVTSALQEGVMTTRMQPISGAWAKLPRLVRDLAHELGKKIELVMTGQHTELDRQVLELIKDPLTHMIRNAADHGLERPEDRAAAGKSQTGRIVLSARHEGGAIVIEVADDGRGLDLTRIRAKALANHLASPGQIDEMSEADLRNFIFAPGFSTATEVTAVSGRGVGMDVVRTNIEKIGGSIELASAEGAGTRFVIRIPLTLTIVSTLVVESCGERFAIPQSSVTELVSVNEASGRQIEYVNGAAVLRLRDRLLPLLSLQGALKLAPEKAVQGETCIVVTRVGAFSFGVIVDRVFDTEEIVVKPVASVLRHLRIYSGATIMGDGAVILILDPKGMSLEMAAGQGANAEDREAEEDVEADDATTSLLVFRATDGSLKAAPLASVSRIEEIGERQLEKVDGRTVVQYRDRLMPVIGSDGSPPQPWGSEELRPLLVFTRQDRAVGILVNEVVDIVESSLTSELEPSGAGAAGSLIIQGAATELLDIAAYWSAAVGRGKLGDLGASAPPSGKSAKRLLVIDQNPFTEVLLEPLLRQAGYDVIIAKDAEAVANLYGRGEVFDLIMADTAPASTGHLVSTLSRATDWHRTPIVTLSAGSIQALSEQDAQRGAA